MGLLGESCDGLQTYTTNACGLDRKYVRYHVMFQSTLILSLCMFDSWALQMHRIDTPVDGLRGSHRPSISCSQNPWKWNEVKRSILQHGHSKTQQDQNFCQGAFEHVTLAMSGWSSTFPSSFLIQHVRFQNVPKASHLWSMRSQILSDFITDFIRCHPIVIHCPGCFILFHPRHCSKGVPGRGTAPPAPRRSHRDRWLPAPAVHGAGSGWRSWPNRRCRCYEKNGCGWHLAKTGSWKITWKIRWNHVSCSGSLTLAPNRMTDHIIL